MDIDADKIEAVAIVGALCGSALVAVGVISPDHFWPFAFAMAVLWGLADVIGVHREDR